MHCAVCVRRPSDSAGSRGCPIFHPVDPAVFSIEMRNLKGIQEQPASGLPREKYDGTVASELDNKLTFEQANI